MMSSQSKNCLVDESWGSTRRHDAGYYITTLIPFIKCWTSLLYCHTLPHFREGKWMPFCIDDVETFKFKKLDEYNA